jgi:AcrR family transcriptional regulator
LAELLAAGRALLAEDGFVTMAAVAQRAGLSRPAAYEYFKSTDDLLAAIVVASLAPWVESGARDLAQITQPEQRLRRFVELYIRTAYGEGLVLSETALPRNVRDRMRETLRPITDLLEESVTALGATDAQHTVRLLQGVVEAAARRTSPGTDPTAEIDAATTFILAGVRGSGFEVPDRAASRR